MTKQDDDSAPPKTALARTSVVGGVAARAASLKVKSEVKAAFLNGEELATHRQQSREEMAALVFEGLSKLRGTALKLAQVFCADTGLLPEEYLRRFEQAHYQVPALSAALVRSVLRRELACDPEAVFSEFDWKAAGAASLGQVHRARLKSNGCEVAVKIQYPGMQESLMADMRLARLALQPMLRTGLLLSTLSQLEERLKEEVDYRREFENLAWFKAQNFPVSVHIPAAYSEHSTARVLVMEWVEGKTLDAWCAGGPARTDVDAMAQRLLGLFRHCVFDRGRFHSDANLGNFLVRTDGSLALLDFGAVTTLPPAEVDFYRALWSRECDMSALKQAYASRGAAVDDVFWGSCVEPYLRWFERLRGGLAPFDFASDKDVVAEGYRIFTSQMFNPQLQNYSDQLTLAHRTFLGLLSLFARMGARVRI